MRALDPTPDTMRAAVVARQHILPPQPERGRMLVNRQAIDGAVLKRVGCRSGALRHKKTLGAPGGIRTPDPQI
ncbi:MAG: hypothetical protein ACK4UU_06685, partial [Fimbriimonadales bacterium]